MKFLLILVAIIFILSGITARAYTFHGYDCTDDCSGHEAGYEWAEENDIDDEDECESHSESFNEGCRAYVEENN
jgi:hypothetical protein